MEGDARGDGMSSAKEQQHQNATDIEHTAAKTLETPVSYTGSFKRIMPMADGGSGWKVAGVVALLALFWLLVTTTFYGIIFGSVVLIIVWFIYTQSRRHRIRDARATVDSRGAAT
jgi:hypothetical protein